MKSKRSRTYLVSGLTLALIFVAIILVFRDVLPDIVKDLSTVPFWGVLLLLALGFAYEAMESVLCLVIIHHKKPDCTFIDALRVTFLGVFGNITTLGAGTLPMQSFYLYRRGLDAGSGLGIMASEYVLHKISVLIYATVALLLGGDWLEQSASGLARYLLIGYVIGALIVIALTLLYTWDKVLKLVLMLLGKLPHTCIDGGTLLNLWLTPAVVQGEEGGHRLSAFLKAFLDMDIFHIQFNVVGQDILRCAQERPEEYRSLLVRVAGYSAYFVELSREVQDDILSRTVNTL